VAYTTRIRPIPQYLVSSNRMAYELEPSMRFTISSVGIHNLYFVVIIRRTNLRAPAPSTNTMSTGSDEGPQMR